jgi:poly(A) polymerase
MLRAIRFACSLGFKIAPETWSVIQSLAAGILQVSWERIRDELIQILTGPAPGSGLDLLHDSGLLVHILPEIEAMREQAKPAEVAGGTNLFARTKSAMNLLRKPSTPLAFATLLHEAGDPAVSREVCRRLRMSTGETDRIVDLVSTHADFVNDKEMRDSALRRIYRRPGFGDHLELLRVHCISHQIKLDAYFRYLNRTKEYVKNPEASLFVTGDDLIAMGYAPGPDFSRILRRVEDLQLDGVLRSRDEALEYVRTAFPVSAGSRL